MIKSALRKIPQQFGYDIVKLKNFNYGKRFKKQSTDHRFDYYETPNGNFYLPKNCAGDVVANAIKTGKLFDADVYNIAKAFIKPGTIVLDIGANYGQMAIEFARAADNIHVYAFEAQRMVFEILEKNIESNACNNISAFYNAVYDSDNEDFLFPVPDLVQFSSYGSYGLNLKAKTGELVKSLTIDSLDFDRPVSFIKIDVQGSDLAAMRGAVNTIRKFKMPILFEFEEQFQQDFNTSFQDYVDFVNEINYKFLKTVNDINYLIVPD